MVRGAGAPARAALLRRLREAVERDERIVGLVDYGSGGEGRLDEWSDLDVALFIRDADLDAFGRDWRGWAAGLGDLLLGYVGRYGHPWGVYDAAPVPLRVDFDLHPASRVDNVLTWPISPASVEAMVLYDATGGRLTARVGEMVGRSLRPADPQAAFERVCGDFWYFLLYVHCKLGRGERWVARQVYHSEVLEHLLLLLRLEAGATDRWEGAPSAWGVERALSPGRLARLDACI
ncbi:MAG: aminoglycoside 6-adenylyltransferase, partial [Chloroflexota bacterium]|nr:aminoglycoside 6-adenylyltransferase [Chloroflexota bacterium]